MDKSKLIEEIAQLHHRLARAMRQYTPDAWMELNLTIAQLKSLFFIDFEGPTNIKKVATALGATPPNVTGIVDRLVEQGLVSREGSPDDRRMLILSTTAKGRALLARLREIETSRMSGILMRLSSGELSALSQSLARFVRAAEESEEDYSDEHNRS
jgi:DNA-binding MarR family transcriptional regulator